MVSVKEVAADKVIAEIKKELAKMPEISMPEWAKFVKSGSHADRKPQQPDWWNTRCASLLRKIYVESKVGVGRLRNWYGGRKNRGSKPEKHVKAGGKIIRTALQQLEKAGLVKKEKTGRILSEKGRSLIDKITLKLKGEKVEKRRRGIKEEKAGATKETKGTGTSTKPVVKKDTKQGSVGKTSKDKPRKSKPVKKS